MWACCLNVNNLIVDIKTASLCELCQFRLRYLIARAANRMLNKSRDRADRSRKQKICLESPADVLFSSRSLSDPEQFSSGQALGVSFSSLGTLRFSNRASVPHPRRLAASWTASSYSSKFLSPSRSTTTMRPCSSRTYPPASRACKMRLVACREIPASSASSS